MDFETTRRGVVGVSKVIETMPPKKKPRNMLRKIKYKVNMVAREDIEVN